MSRVRLSRALFAAAAAAALPAVALSCGTPDDGSPAAPPPSGAPIPQTFAIGIASVDTKFVTRDHFIAGVEMQIAGEPFAEAMGRDLGGYSRDYVCPFPPKGGQSVCSPSTYYDPLLNGGVAGGKNGRTDLPGFATAVESYEYSKQPMNNVAFESGAGTSLAFGSVINASRATGAGALTNLRFFVQHMAAAANTTSTTVSTTATDANPLGWPGFWPTLQPFTTWDPTIKPTNASTGCSISSDDDPGAGGALMCDDYECDYTTLHLPNRAAQVDMTISPGASGWVGWKDALWTINYTQVMHDVNETGVTSVPEDQLAAVGAPGNVVLATDDGAAAGTFLGSSNIEGFQAGTFIQILDDQAAQWLGELSTADGATLGGFASVGDALAYSDASPLRWFPGAIKVTEADDASGFPRPASYAIASPDSHLLDLAGLLGSMASAYSLTDTSNTQVGGAQSVRVYFDGDPFPVQNQTPAGSATLHDRALAMMRVLVVDIDRLHVDPTTGVFVDDVTLAGGQPSRGATLSTDTAAYALLALRTARRALDGTLALYSNTKPDAQGVPCPLDALAAVRGQPFGARLDTLIASLAGVFYDHLTTDDGVAYAGLDAARSTPTGDGTSLDAHAAAIRGLLVAYLATGDARYRERATKVFDRLEAQFYDPHARMYRLAPGDTSTTITFTPRRFGILEGALRDTYELVALLPGNGAMASLIEERVERLVKLVLNGWDDRDQDQQIEWPTECIKVITGPDGVPMGTGALQMAERVLTGESGSLADVATPSAPRFPVTDREKDCVPEISAVGLPSALANSVTFTLTPVKP